MNDMYRCQWALKCHGIGCHAAVVIVWVTPCSLDNYGIMCMLLWDISTKVTHVLYINYLVQYVGFALFVQLIASVGFLV